MLSSCANSDTRSSSSSHRNSSSCGFGAPPAGGCGRPARDSAATSTRNLLGVLRIPVGPLAEFGEARGRAPSGTAAGSASCGHGVAREEARVDERVALRLSPPPPSRAQAGARAREPLRPAPRARRAIVGQQPERAFRHCGQARARALHLFGERLLRSRGSGSSPRNARSATAVEHIGEQAVGGNRRLQLQRGLCEPGPRLLVARGASLSASRSRRSDAGARRRARPRRAVSSSASETLSRRPPAPG